MSNDFLDTNSPEYRKSGLRRRDQWAIWTIAPQLTQQLKDRPNAVGVAFIRDQDAPIEFSITSLRMDYEGWVNDLLEEFSQSGNESFNYRTESFGMSDESKAKQDELYELYPITLTAERVISPRTGDQGWRVKARRDEFIDHVPSEGNPELLDDTYEGFDNEDEGNFDLYLENRFCDWRD